MFIFRLRPMAASELGFPQVENGILIYRRLLESSPRSDPHRPAHLLRLGLLLNNRYAFSLQKGDLDKSITHLTEAVLLPLRQPSQDVVRLFFQLASIVLSRFWLYNQLEDLKSSLKYFRFLRDNFRPLETFGIPHDLFTLRLIRALTKSLKSESGDMIQDMEEMTALIPGLLVSDVSKNDLMDAITSFSIAVTTTFRPGEARQAPERVILVLREATIFIPDSQDVSCALATCLAAHPQTTHVIEDYEEAITIAEKIIATCSPGDGPTPTQEYAIFISVALMVLRSNSYTNPEYLESDIERLRAFLSVPLRDHLSNFVVFVLNSSVQKRSMYFGLTGESPKAPFDDPVAGNIFLLSRGRTSRRLDAGPDDDSGSWIQEKSTLLSATLTAILNDETTDVEGAVELARTLIPPPHSIHRSSYVPALTFAKILRRAYDRTKKSDYLNEAIIAYRGLRKVSAPRAVLFEAGYGLAASLFRSLCLFPSRQDYEEVMQLCAKVVNDGSAEAFRRFDIAYRWTIFARRHGHSSISTAYGTAMSLMQEVLVFSPTLQTQHFHLVGALKGSEEVPSDYASYQIEGSRHKQAVETLEQGRALLWSEMRGLRTSTDQLRAADSVLADKFATVNRNLEIVTMSVAQSENTERNKGLEGTSQFGHLLTRQRRLLEERDSLISDIQTFSGLGNFLKPPSFDSLNSAALHGPVIIINQSGWRSDIIIILKDSPPSIIATPSDFHDRANRLKEQLLHVRKEKGLDSEEYVQTLAFVLKDLYELVGKPVIGKLREFKILEKSRVRWCPTSAFCSLPLHAMGPITSDGGKELYFLDLYITSYTPTLSALIESRKPGSQLQVSKKSSLLLVAQPETLPGAWDEIDVLGAVVSPVTSLVSEKATPTTVVAGLRDHRFVHFVCHSLLETGKPFDASFELYGDNLTLLEIVRSKLPAAEFAFLSACHTAELTEDSVADEGLHLAAAMQFCGFRSVVGTTWAMADTDGADLSRHFYKAIFSESRGRKQVPYYERSARALQFAVKKLRKKRGITLERWVNFVHYGA